MRLRKEMKIIINSKIIVLFVTISLLLLIFFSGEANAIILHLNIPEKIVTRGTLLNIMPEIQVEPSEIVNIDSIELKIYNKDESINCKFFPNATIISGCKDITIEPIITGNESMFGYGYGYTYRAESNYGYGYGYEQGLLKYKISINTGKLEIGKYNTEFTINVGEKNFNIKGDEISITNNLRPPKLKNRCSIRAFDGTFSVDETDFSNNRIKFYITKRDTVGGKGSLSGQKGRERFSYRFNMDKIIENNESNLITAVSGIYRIGRDGVAKNIPENATVNFDRINNRVTITGDKIKIKTMLVNFIEGCEFL